MAAPTGAGACEHRDPYAHDLSTFRQCPGPRGRLARPHRTRPLRTDARIDDSQPSIWAFEGGGAPASRTDAAPRAARRGSIEPWQKTWIEMVDLSDLIRPEAIIPALKASSKKQAIQELAEKAAEITGVDERQIFETLLQRERLGSTGVGGGVAIPHG